MVDIYGKKESVENVIELIKSSDLSEINKQYILEFDHENRIRNCKAARRTKLLRQMRIIAKMISKEFSKDLCELDRDLIDEYMCRIYENPKFRPYTKHDYWRIIVQFIKRHPKMNTEIIREHSANGRKYGEFVFMEKLETLSEKETIITEEDIKKVIKHCKNKRNRAFISLLHETGTRAGEILNIRYKDIRHKDNILIIKVDGKTGLREVPVLSSKVYLTEYLNDFVYTNPSEIIWRLEGNFQSCRKTNVLSHAGATKVVREAFKVAGLEHKKHNLHYFRHSRATINAEFMTDAQMCKFFGWTIGSDQASTYVNLNTLDVENVVLKRNGIDNTKKSISGMAPQTCNICNHRDNTPTANYCQRCGSPLNLEIAMNEEKLIREETDKSIKLLMEISKDPYLMRRFEEFKQGINP